MLDLKLIVITTHGDREEFNLAEMWDYYNENFDDEGVSFGDYLSSVAWNWAASGNQTPILIDGWLDHNGLSEYVHVDNLSKRKAFQEIGSILEWLEDHVNYDTPFGRSQALAFLAYVGSNGWEYINFDEIDGFMEDTYCGSYSSLWDYVEKELIGNHFIAPVPNWLRDAVNEEDALENLVQDGMMEYYYGTNEYFIFRH